MFEDNFPGHTPTNRIVWPAARHQVNQIEQTKITAKAQANAVQPSTQPSRPVVPARTTPQTVSGIRIILRSASGQKTVTVQFAHPSGDPYFGGAKVYLRRAGQQPVLVAGGSESPLTFTVDNHPAPHSIYVTSVGSWGETPVLQSPSRPVRLA
jgi:hypothetical protein